MFRRVFCYASSLPRVRVNLALFTASVLTAEDRTHTYSYDL